MPARKGLEQQYYRKVSLWLLQALPTDTESRYAQIEKELLAVVFALDMFQQYAYGRPVTIESDHKPLEAIAKKPLRCAPKRLQGIFLKIQKFDINIVYNPGSRTYLAETLSRVYLPSRKNTQRDFEIYC